MCYAFAHSFSWRKTSLGGGGAVLEQIVFLASFCYYVEYDALAQSSYIGPLLFIINHSHSHITHVLLNLRNLIIFDLYITELLGLKTIFLLFALLLLSVLLTLSTCHLQFRSFFSDESSTLLKQ